MNKFFHFIFLLSFAHEIAVSQIAVVGENNCNYHHIKMVPSFNVPISANGYSYKVDLDGDSFNDFSLEVSYFTGGLAGTTWSAEIVSLGGAEVVFDHQDSSYNAACNPSWSFVNIPKEFSVGDTISPQMDWRSGTMTFANHGYYMSCQWNYPGAPGSNVYVGLRVCQPSDTVYGWMRFDTVGAGVMVLNEYACRLDRDSIKLVKNISDTSIVCGNKLLYRVKASAKTCLNYEWYWNGGIIPGENSDSLVIPVVTTNFLGTYQCKIFNNFDTLYSSLATLDMGAIGTVNIDVIGDSLPFVGQELILSISNIDSTKETKWYKNGLELPGEIKNYLLIGCVLPQSAGAYSSRVISLCDDTIYSNVINIQPKAFIAESNQTVCESYLININVQNAEFISGQWMHNGDTIAGAYNSNYFKYSELKDAGEYIYRAVSLCGDTIFSNPLTIQVYPVPVPMITRSGNILCSNYDSGNYWTKEENGNYIPIGNDSCLLLAEHGTYRLDVLNPEGCWTLQAAYYNADLEFEIFPNPMINELKITQPSWENYYEWNLYNDVGQKVQNGVIGPGMNVLNVTERSPGIYFLIFNGKSYKLLKPNVE